MTPEQITAKLELVGVKAVLAQPRVRLVTKVNHRDNFALRYARIAHDAMLSAVVKVIDGRNCARKDAYTGWLNHASTTSARNPNRSIFEALARTAAGKAYDKQTKTK